MALLKLKDLKNRRYEDKLPVYFEYDVVDDTGREKKNLLTCRFRSINDQQWQVQAVLSRTAFMDSIVINFAFELPKANMALSYVASVGLKLLQGALTDNIEREQMIEFTLSDILADPVVA